MPADLPIGQPVQFEPVSLPARQPLRGRYVTLRPLDAAEDAQSLYAVSHPPDGDPAIWTYLFDGPYADLDAMREALAIQQRSADRLFFTVAPLPSERACGVASYMRMVPEHGVIEIGNIWFGTPMQRTTAATEAIFLLARHVFDDLGYRRLEWKCNALNAGSRRAAERFGFTFEGVFREHMVVKGHNRDTAWYAIVDQDWPAIREAFQRWLDPDNFDPDGVQRQSLGSFFIRP